MEERVYPLIDGFPAEPIDTVRERQPILDISLTERSQEQTTPHSERAGMDVDTAGVVVGSGQPRPLARAWSHPRVPATIPVHESRCDRIAGVMAVVRTTQPDRTEVGSPCVD